MSKPQEKASALRKPRSDALRNRELLLAAAKKVFNERGAAATLDEIARQAGVGIGTLYRHFPMREDVIDAVYQIESEQIFNAGAELTEKHPPLEALRAWLMQFVDYMEIKHGMNEILNAAASPHKLKPPSGKNIQVVLEQLVNKATASGDIELTGDPLDLLRAIAGVLSMNKNVDRKQAARRMVDVMLAGMKKAPR